MKLKKPGGKAEGAIPSGRSRSLKEVLYLGPLQEEPPGPDGFPGGQEQLISNPTLTAPRYYKSGTAVKGFRRLAEMAEQP